MVEQRGVCLTGASVVYICTVCEGCAGNLLAQNLLVAQLSLWTIVTNYKDVAMADARQVNKRGMFC